MVENGRKWWKMGCRGYLVGNGFPRFLRHSPTTHTLSCLQQNSKVSIEYIDLNR